MRTTDKKYKELAKMVNNKFTDMEEVTAEFDSLSGLDMLWDTQEHELVTTPDLVTKMAAVAYAAKRKVD